MVSETLLLQPPRVTEPVRPILWLRTGLLVAWLIAAPLVVVLGEHESQLSGLEHDLATHSVSTVAVAGEGLSVGETGSTVQTLHWRDGLIRRFAEVRVEVPDPDTDGDSVSTVDEPKFSTVQSRDAGAYLAEHHQVPVTRTQDPASFGDMAGWRIPMFLSFFYIFVGLVALILLTTGPPPWRATRWAWFWFSLIPVVGTPAYLLLGGPVPLVPAPRPGRRPVAGGLAFIAYLCLSRW